MEKKRKTPREFSLTLLLVLSGIIVLSWLGQATGSDQPTGYITQRPAVRGFSSDHHQAWLTASQRFSSSQPSSPSEISRTTGEVLQQTPTGYFVRIENRRIIFGKTTQSFSRGDRVMIEYRSTKAGEIFPLRMTKA